MKAYQHGDEVNHNGEKKIVQTRRKNFQTNKITYILQGEEGQIPEKELSDWTGEEIEEQIEETVMQPPIEASAEIPPMSRKKPNKKESKKKSKK